MDDDLEQQRRLSLDDIVPNHKSAPPIDELFVEKYVQFQEGNLPVYVCKIPTAYVKPFSMTYYPTDFPPFLPFIAHLKEKIKQGEYPPLWVYQQGRFFVMSDNYPAYFAYLESECPFVMANCLGKPDHPAVTDVQGPFYNKDAPRSDGD